MAQGVRVFYFWLAQVVTFVFMNNPPSNGVFDPAGNEPYTLNKTNATVNQHKKLNKLFQSK
jgi:hypothetical protein